MRLLITTSIFLLTTTISQAQPPAPLSSEGRFLYANDDDWDWARPLGSNLPSKLADSYGVMPWSALDWMEEGLPEVRGMLVGTPPVLGEYLTMADLNKQRGAGPKVSYEQILHKKNTLVDLLRDKKPPNVVILMQDTGHPSGPLIFAEDVSAAFDFVQRGGRLLVLDDWQLYRNLISPYLDTKKFPPLKLPAAKPQDEKQVLAKVKLLDHEKFVVRQQATQDLLKMGPKILPVLQGVKATSPEQAQRIAQLLHQLKPPPVISLDRDTWLLETARTACQLHALCELKIISRNGTKEPGSALCLRLPLAKTK